MKKCNKCNFESDEFEFCPKCGSKLEKVEEGKDNILDKISTVAKDKIRDRNKISNSDKKIMIVVFSILILGAMAGIIFGKKNPELTPIDENTNETIIDNTNENEKNDESNTKVEENNYTENKKEEVKVNSKYDIEVDAKTLSKVYYNNELDGNKKYFGKRIKTTGKFTSAEKGRLTGWNVVLVTGERYDYYCSTFAEGEEKHFSEYNRGETLIVYAKVDELVGGYLRLKDCDLERKK